LLENDCALTAPQATPNRGNPLMKVVWRGIFRGSQVLPHHTKKRGGGRRKVETLTFLNLRILDMGEGHLHALPMASLRREGSLTREEGMRGQQKKGTLD